MFKFALPAVAALGLIVVAAQSEATNADAEAGAAAPMGWHLTHEGPMAKLAYGVANSDQLALMMTCEPGQAQAIVYGDVQPASPRLHKASISLRDPTLQRLVRRGRLDVEGDAGHFELTAHGDERRLVSAFFAYCGTEAV